MRGFLFSFRFCRNTVYPFSFIDLFNIRMITNYPFYWSHIEERERNATKSLWHGNSIARSSEDSVAARKRLSTSLHSTEILRRREVALVDKVLQEWKYITGQALDRAFCDIAVHIVGSVTAYVQRPRHSSWTKGAHFAAQRPAPPKAANQTITSFS